MAKVSNEKIIMDGPERGDKLLNFKYDIQVSKEGVFSAMLPKDIIELFKSANIDLQTNRLNNEGYYSDSTLEGLKTQLRNVCKEYLSRELILETIVLKFGVETRASYCLGSDGTIYPNGQFPGAMKKDDSYVNGEYANWRNGTVSINATSKSNYGILVYAYPYKKEVYEYKSGKLKTEYVRLDSFPENMPNLEWLNKLTCIAPGSGFGGTSNSIKIQEIEYTEKIGAVFVNMIKSICALNEQIKDFLTPEGILEIAEGNQKLLG